MQNPLQSSEAGVSAGRQLTQIRLQILGAGQKPIWSCSSDTDTGDFARALVAADLRAAAGSTTPHRIHQNATMPISTRKPNRPPPPNPKIGMMKGPNPPPP